MAGEMTAGGKEGSTEDSWWGAGRVGSMCGVHGSGHLKHYPYLFIFKLWL